MATTTADKIRENRLREAAKRQGYEIRKSRRRDPRALDYGGWMIVDAHTKSVEAGDLTYGGLSLDEVEKWLTSDHARTAVAG